MQGELPGGAMYVTFGVHKGSAFSGTDLSDIADIFQNWWNTDISVSVTNQLAMNAIKVTDLTTPSSPTFTLSPVTPGTGTVTSGPVNDNAALVVTCKTANRGRSFRGRNYWGGLPAGALTNSTEWSVGTVTAWSGFYPDLANALGVAGFEHVILSRFNAGVRRSVGVFTRVVDYQAKRPIGTQRRRVIGHGI